eukprot:989686-Pelagomonas_calceolata.AAC.3
MQGCSGQESRQDPWLPLRPPVFLKGPFTKGNGGSRLIGPESQVGGSRLWAKAWGPQSCMGFTAPHTVPPRLALRAYTQSATHFALYNVERLSAWWVVCSRSEGYVSAVCGARKPPGYPQSAQAFCPPVQSYKSIE